MSIIKKILIVVKKLAKYFIYFIGLFLLVGYIYFTFYPNLVYLDDETIISYLNKYQKDFDDIIKVKENNCGKYFFRQDKSFFEYENQPRTSYYYYDDFFARSPEAKEFIKKHKNIIISIVDNSSQEDSIYKSAADDKIYGINSRRPYTREDALKACRSKSYIIFYIRNTAYLKLRGLSLNGPYSAYKRLIYANTSQAKILEEWELYKNHPNDYNNFYSPQGNPELTEFDKKKLGVGILSRATSYSNEHFMEHCNNYGELHGTFRKIKPKWFLLTSHGQQGTCASDWRFLPLIPFFEGIHFKSRVK